MFTLPAASLFPLLAFTIVFLLLAWSPWRKRRQAEGDGKDVARDPTLWIVAVSGAVVTVLFVPNVWLPAEVVETNRGNHVGYVLGAEAGFVTVLQEDERRLVRVDEDAITDREVCALPRNMLNQPALLAHLVWGPEQDYPKCPAG